MTADTPVGVVQNPPLEALVDAAPEPAPVHPPTPAVGAPVAGEAFLESLRLLALNLTRLLPDTGNGRSVLVMSALPGDGRSTVTAALATAMCEGGEQVLLVDADPVGAGLRHRWRDGAPDRDGFRLADPALDLHTYAPEEAGLRSQSLFLADVRAALQAAAARDLTALVDTPACLMSTVAFSLAGAAGGVLYVARRRRAGRVPHADIRSQLDLLGANVLGVVFNEA